MNDENLTFLTASEFGSYLRPGSDKYRRFGLDTNSEQLDGSTRIGFVPTDFAGINSNIYEPISSSLNTLGFPTTMPVQAYVNWGSPDTPAIYFTNNDDEAFIGRNLSTTSPYVGTAKPAVILNSVILHRQGPYGWPSWKQVRVGNHPVNRSHRKNNIISYADKSVSTNPVYVIGAPFPTPVPILLENTTSFQFTESAISNRYNPLDHLFTVEQGGKSQMLTLRHSYGNLKSHYSTEKYNIKLVFPNAFKDMKDSVYDDLKKLYIDKEFDFPNTTPFKLWHKFTYSENVFPREKNTYLNRTRKRTEYAEVAGFGSNGYDRRDFRTFWKDNLADRNSRTPSVAFNHMGYTTVYQQSFWSLDTGGTTPGNRQGNAIGQLLFPLGMGATSPVTGLTNTGSLSLYRFPTNVAATPVDRYLYGIPFYATDQISGKKPFFNTYEDFVEDIRGLGKDYTILPEFKISDHMDYYVTEKEGDFLATNSQLFSMVGGNVTSSAASVQVSTGHRSELTSSLLRPRTKNKKFFAEYSHSDFLKYFDKFYDDHKLDGKISKYSFTVKGIKKLLPYKGFYPHQRAIQVGTLLSQSYGTSITGSTTNPALKENEHLAAFLRPLASPGIMFNSLKSAIAVDYPVFTGSVAVLNAQQDSTFTQLFYWNVSQNYRLPFETIIQPEAYVPIVRQADIESGNYVSKVINFDEPMHAGTPINLFGFALRAGGDPRYTLAANNFFGEIPRFFLEQQRLTTFVSAQEGDFVGTDPGKSYYMDVVLRKSSNMLLSEGQTNVGGGDYNFNQTRGVYYGPPVSSGFCPLAAVSNVRDPAYAPYTPPYFYEDSIARIKYTAPATGGKPSLADILSSAQQLTEYTGSSIQLGLNDFASKNKMTISASVNLFGTSRVKEVEYKTGLGPEGNFIPISAKDTSTTGFNAWSIGTRFECPALNFNASTDFHSASTGRGLWGGYGVVPKRDEGVWIDLRESFPARGATGIDGSLTGSLIDLCGFTTKSKRVGTPAKYKIISEAIVAIPFVYDVDPSAGENVFSNFITPLSGGRKFFKISQAIWNNIVADVNAGNNPNSVSIADMYNKMRRYYLPPQFNCVDFPEAVRPIVMYIFEFEHVLSQQDLTDIWQGLMPKISTQAEEAMSSIEHGPGLREFFHGLDLPKQTRWMLFKVKRKAEKSYFATTADTTDDSRFKFQFGNTEKPPEYNYNWPYDFFSLVELAKMDASVEFRNVIEADLSAISDADNTAQVAPGAAAAAIPAGGLLGGGE